MEGSGDKLRGQFKYKPNFFFLLKSRDSPVKQNRFTGSYGIPITVITYHCVPACFLSLVITMSEQMVPSVVAQRIIVTFVINGNVSRLCQDSEHSSVMKRSLGPRCTTWVNHLKKAEQRLKTCENYICCREKAMASVFGNLSVSYSSIF